MTMEDRSGPGIERADGAAASGVAPCQAQVRTAVDGITSDAAYPLRRNGSSAIKRSFDVAFLVAPDEKLTRRQSSVAALDQGSESSSHSPSPGYSVPVILDRCSPSSASPPFQRLHQHLPRLHDPAYVPAHLQDESSLAQLPKSAFTKVSSLNSFEEAQGTSPRSSTSPDHLSYRGSVSPPGLPTVAAKNPSFKYGSFAAAAAAAAVAAAGTRPFPFLVNSTSEPVVQPCVTAPSGLADNLKIGRKISGTVESTGFRSSGDLSPAAAAAVYSNLSYSPISVFPAPMAEALVRPRHFLAGVTGVAGLLPPSFTLSLPAQNVCAKCNLSFRMTSDLVYHMRSHHKNENVGEAARRRREEKLRCPVCDESFRERHHLTRHMTAHQDKESDAISAQQAQLSPGVKQRSPGAPTVVHGTAK